MSPQNRSLGDEKIDDSVGIGYTGLAAALERMSRSKTSSSIPSSAGAGAGAGVAREKTGDVLHHVHELHHPLVDQHPPTLPPIPGLPLSRSSATGRSSAHGRDDGMGNGGPGHNSPSLSLRQHLHNQYQPQPEREREPSLMNYTIKSGSSTRSASRGGDRAGGGDRGERGERRMSIADGFERIVLGNHHSNNGAGSIASSGIHRTDTHSQSHHNNHNHSSHSNSNHHNHTNYPGASHSYSQNHTDSAADSLLAEDMDAFEPFKVVRFKADPAAQPRWTPRNTVGADNHSLRESLLSAVETRNAKLVEQLLDRGVTPNMGPHAHILNQAIAHHDTETVRILLLFGADPNAADARGVTPLFVSVEESSLEAATMLLK